MNLEAFARPLTEVLGRSLAAPDRPLVWTIIANPIAGGFTIRSRWKENHAIVCAYAEMSRANPLRRRAGPSRTALEMDPGLGVLGKLGLAVTTGPGCAGAIARALIREVQESIPDGGAVPQRTPFHLIITAGGDGTSLEVLSALYGAPRVLRSNFAVLRLPMGTGNDGADGRVLNEALDLLIRPSRIEFQRALTLRTAGACGPADPSLETPSGPAGKGPFLAFNILSVGLDAFVTRMTNRMKGSLPGDSYKLWVDIAALLYDRIYKVGPLRVRAFDDTGAPADSFNEKVLLLAMGVSGRRTYGSQKRILPDERNVCMVKQMPLLRKLALKGLFTTGGHVKSPEAVLFSAGRVEFSGEHPILAQMDGETVLLEPGDFPASIELTEPVIPVLKNR
jgi:diacylglycerol kinase family enzyme